jgi:hypothetical protein
MKYYDENAPLENRNEKDNQQETQRSESLKEEKDRTEKKEPETGGKNPVKVPKAPETESGKSAGKPGPDPAITPVQPETSGFASEELPESEEESSQASERPVPSGAKIEEEPSPETKSKEEPSPEPKPKEEPSPETKSTEEPVKSSEIRSYDDPEQPDPGELSGAAPKEKSAHGPVQPESRERSKDLPIRLIDDQEEQERNLNYDYSLDEEEDEKESDEDEQQDDDEEEEERVNLALLSKEDLVKLLREKLDNPGRGNIRRDVEEIRTAFYLKHEETLEEKRKNFLEEGGAPEDFKPVEDPVELGMRELLAKYRSIRAEFSKQLEKSKQENLRKKQEILEQFRDLMEGQHSFDVTFRRFKDLQKRWFAAGVVPQQNLKDLWDSYNYFVDKFNGYVGINRELRALDLRKNLELKIQLCERTEALEKDENVVQAFKTLQKYHARWREIGPIPREHRDEIWERFKQATSVINRKHQEHHTRLKESLYENLKRKTELCEKVETLAAIKYDSHAAWVEKTNQVLSIQKNWKTIGYAPKKDNNAIYERFRRACDVFFQNKAEFYAAAYEGQKQNLKLKTEIADKAELLSNSKDWKETTNELIRLQKQWKEIGPVPRRDSDKLWRRFRAACDKFFSQKSRHFETIDSTFEENLDAKEKLITDMQSFTPSGNRKKDMASVEEFQERFNKIGFVPSDKKDRIKENFRQEQERLLERVGMDEDEMSLFRFRSRIRALLESPRSEIKIDFERDKLINKLQQLKGDIGVWENNIGFFKQSESSEDTIQGFHEKIEDAHRRIRMLEQKIRILDDMDNTD